MLKRGSFVALTVRAAAGDDCRSWEFPACVRETRISRGAGAPCEQMVPPEEVVLVPVASEAAFV
jgi:hypothetical protein